MATGRRGMIKAAVVRVLTLGTPSIVHRRMPHTPSENES